MDPTGELYEQVKPEDAGSLQAVYVLDAITRLLGEGYDQTNDMVAWYVELLRCVAPVGDGAASTSTIAPARTNEEAVPV